MLIYVISFLEALSGGLVGVNTALYFKFTLGLSETQAASIFSGMGVLGSALILLLGPMVDKIGVKRAMLIGAGTLVLGRIALSQTHSLILALFMLIFMSIGSAIKGSAVLITLRSQGKSFKLDYVIFNLAYCIAGFLFDYIHNYNLTFLIAGLIAVINLAAIMFLAEITPDNLRKSVPITESGQKATAYDYKILKKVVLYNSVMLPVSGIFTFMATFIPKWAIAAIGPSAPVGKLYGSLNPAIILAVVPIFAVISNRWRLNPYRAAIVGTTLSGLSLFFILLPLSWLSAAIAVIVLFTVGEAVWSPANMEVGTTLCPPGEEGKYLTISLIPRTLIGLLMSYIIAYDFNHFVYVPSPQYWVPFISMGAFSLLTPIGLVVFRGSLLDSKQHIV